MAKPKSIPQWQQFLVRWIPVSGTAGLTFFFASSEKFGTALIAAFCTGAMLLWTNYSAGFMAIAEQEAEKLGNRHAQWLIQLIAVVGRTLSNRILAVLPLPLTTTTEYYQKLSLDYRELEPEGIRLSGFPELEQVFIEVHLSPCESEGEVNPRLLVRRRNEEPQDNVGFYLARMPKHWSHRRLAILGAPGSGKTTLMRHIALMYAQRQPHKLHPKAPQLLPVLLYLREIHPQILADPAVSLVSIITQWASKRFETDSLLKPDESWFAAQLRQNQCLILLDGFDEIADATDRQQVSQWVDHQIGKYPNTAFILTSRPLGYKEAPLKKKMQFLEVQPLTSQQINDFVHRWYITTEHQRRAGKDPELAERKAKQKAASLLKQIDDRNLSAFVSNPLLLTLIAESHRFEKRIPTRKVELYQTIFQVMLVDRPKEKGFEPLPLPHSLSVLQPLALALMRQGITKFTFEAVEPILTEYLAKLPNQPDSFAFLKELQAVDALIDKEKEADYEFAHKTFQEYLAALEVQKTSQQQIFLTALQSEQELDWWQETMRFYVAVPDTDSTALVQAIVQEAQTAQAPNLEKILLAWDFGQDGLVEEAQRQTLRSLMSQPLEILEPADLQYAQEVQPRYFPLAHYLQTGQWQAADREMFDVMNRVMGGLSIANIKKFPCEDLRVIDQLWLNYSQGKFGFSVQKRIWVEVGGKLDYATDTDAALEAYKKLSDQVKWCKDGIFLNYSDITFEVAPAPEGHLPLWVFWVEDGGSSLLSHPSL
ncbi:MAG: GUN4 domain-containing protein [Cyanobacteria bacterium P01_G01_bin.54]